MLELRHLRHLNSRQLLLLLLLLLLLRREEVVVGLARRALMWASTTPAYPPGAVPFAREHARPSATLAGPIGAAGSVGRASRNPEPRRLPRKSPCRGRIVRGTAPADGPRAEAREQRRRRRRRGRARRRRKSQRPAARPAKRRREGVRACAALAAGEPRTPPPWIASSPPWPPWCGAPGRGPGRAGRAWTPPGRRAVVARVERFPRSPPQPPKPGAAARDAVVPVRAAEPSPEPFWGVERRG